MSSGPSPRGEWVRGPGAEREDGVVLYVHGSAYTICSARTHRGITTRLSAKTGLPVFACDYRLAPNHRFPAAADDVRAAYDWLINEGHDPERIVLAGDSAGFLLCGGGDILHSAGRGILHLIRFVRCRVHRARLLTGIGDVGVGTSGCITL